MVLLRYLLIFAGIGLLAGAAAILAWDLFQIVKARRGGQTPPEPRWEAARRGGVMGVAPLLVGLSIAVVPSGEAGVRVNQFSGTRPSTLYPGVHLMVPLIEQVATYDVRDNVFTTKSAADVDKPSTDSLRVQTREGLMVGLAVAVRYRLDPTRLAYIHSNLPQPVEEGLVRPLVARIFFGGSAAPTVC